MGWGQQTGLGRKSLPGETTARETTAWTGACGGRHLVGSRQVNLGHIHREVGVEWGCGPRRGQGDHTGPCRLWEG